MLTRHAHYLMVTSHPRCFAPAHCFEPMAADLDYFVPTLLTTDTDRTWAVGWLVQKQNKLGTIC